MPKPITRDDVVAFLIEAAHAAHDWPLSSNYDRDKAVQECMTAALDRILYWRRNLLFAYWARRFPERDCHGNGSRSGRAIRPNRRRKVKSPDTRFVRQCHRGGRALGTAAGCGYLHVDRRGIRHQFTDSFVVPCSRHRSPLPIRRSSIEESRSSGRTDQQL